MRTQHDNPLDYESAKSTPSPDRLSWGDCCTAAGTALLLVYLPLVMILIGGGLGDGPGDGFVWYLIAICVAAPLGLVLSLFGMTHTGLTRIVATIAALLHGLMLLTILHAVANP